MIRFTIITCTWNAAEVVERTLESVLSQSWAQIEHVIIDGASKDNTLQLVEAYRKRNAEEETEHDIVVVSEPDRGLYDAMNKGIRRAKGEYLIFLNAGDAFHAPSSLQEIADAIEQGAQPDIVYGQTQIVDADRNFVAMRHLTAPEHLTFDSFKHGMLVCHQAFVVRRALAEPYDLRYRFSADYEWCLRCLKKAKRCAYTGTTLIDYLADGLTDKNHKASLRERYDIMCQYYGTLPTIVRHIGFFARNLKRKLLK